MDVSTPDFLPDPDLYQLIKQKREEELTPIARLLLAIQVSEKGEFEEETRSWIRRTEEEYKTELTGFMLVKGVFIVHLLEGESEILNEYLKYLHSEFNKEKSFYIAITILIFNEENPNRCFAGWSSESVFQTGPPIVDIDKSDQQMVDRAYQIYLMFCAAGEKTLKKGGRKEDNKLGADIPLTNEDLYILIQKRFLGINEYEEMYLQDVEVDLDGDRVFPMTPGLLNYLEFSDLGKLTQLRG